MEVPLNSLSDKPDELKELIVQLVRDQRSTKEKFQQEIQHKEQQLLNKQNHIELLEEKLRGLQRHRFGSKSEKHPGQGELQLFNEAELVLDSLPEESKESEETIDVPAHKRKKRKSRALPANLPRVEVIHDLADSEKCCDCGEQLVHIDDEILEQLAVIPLQYYVIRHIRRKYACSCKRCLKTASMPAQPLPKSQASPQLIAQTLVAKFADGLPLYRQEKIAARNGVDLPRAKTARWVIESATLFRPLYNLLQDSFFSYDIAQSDDTGIQVLIENGREPGNNSYLWIRRGGPPTKPVVLVDYSPSRSGETAYGLLEDFRGYLVADAYGGYNRAIKRNGLKLVACNDHARRRFDEVLKNLSKKQQAKSWVAKKAIAFYKVLYKIEADIKGLEPQQKVQVRQAKSLKIWQEFRDWIEQVNREGVLHSGTREAIAYLLNHWEALTRYCEDGRLPISNIQSEHVAKTIAVARKNFLFCDTPAGAHASAMAYSILETAREHGHNPFHYLTVLLTELPIADTLEDFEALLPWNITKEQVDTRFGTYPKP